jgi:hypothetical protein
VAKPFGGGSAPDLAKEVAWLYPIQLVWGTKLGHGPTTSLAQIKVAETTPNVVFLASFFFLFYFLFYVLG